MPITPATSAGSRVAGITELLELVLQHLPAKDLVLAQRTSQQFNSVIKTSSALRSNFQSGVLRNCQLHAIPTSLLEPHPKLFQSCHATKNRAKGSKAPTWFLEFTVDTKVLGYGRPGSTASWRRLLMCSELTRHVLGVLTVEPVDHHYSWNSGDSDEVDEEEYGDGGEDDHAVVESSFDDPSGHEEEEAFTSDKGITLGDLADRACALRDRAHRSPRDGGYGIVFMATVDAAGRSKKIAPSS